MTKTDWTAEEVRKTRDEYSECWCIPEVDGPVPEGSQRIMDMLTAFAERIAADESAVSAEDRFEHFVRTSIDNAPEPLRRLGEYLTRVLDEDEWPTAERILLGIATNPPAQPAQPAQVVCPKCHGTGEVSDSDGLYVGQCTACCAIKQPAQEQPGWKWVPVMPTEEMLKASAIAWTGLCHGYSPGCGHYKFMDGLWRAMLDSSPAPPEGEVRLWDTQWMNIVNHDNCYRDWDKTDAINHAVKMTEQAIARNVADGKLPTAHNAASPTPPKEH